MSKMISMKDATPTNLKETLCTQCKKATFVRGSNGEQTIRCHELECFVTYKVQECSSYEHINTISLYDMHKIAWILDTSQKDKDKIGFRSPKDMKDDMHDIWEKTAEGGRRAGFDV